MSVQTVTDGASRAETPAEIRNHFSSHPAVTAGGERLAALLAQRQELDDAIAREERIARTPALAEAAAACGVTVDELTGPGRPEPVAAARAVAAWMLRADGWSLPEIGWLLGRHHTSVLAAVRRCESDVVLRTVAGELHRVVAAVREAA